MESKFVHRTNEKKCLTCGKILTDSFKYQCDRCRIIDKAEESMEIIKDPDYEGFGYRGHSKCFYCGSDISSREWYRTGKCSECEKKDSLKAIEALKFRIRLLSNK